MTQQPSRDDDDPATMVLPAAAEMPSQAPTPQLEGSVDMAASEASCRRQVLAGRYELLCLCGVGGMGNVYQARDLELDEIVAIKALRRELGSSPGMLERFRREVRLSRRVTHPNVARVFDIGEHAGEKFLSMEFIDGESLAAILGREGPLDIDRAVELTRAVCAGLSAAHQAGVIHRDLKPDNVLVARDGRVVLTDFGIARAFDQGGGTQTMGFALGTPAYMAPEQVEGRDDIDGRADIYALGAMLYEMFTGVRAWGGDGPFAIAAARLLADPPDPRRRRPDLPDAFARLILKCMARSRDDRFATADLVASELASLTQPAAHLLSPRPLPHHEAAPALLSSRATDKVVAVLPFRNQGAADDEYLADELTDDLIDTLSMTRGLKVRPRATIARWKGADDDPREIGRELGAQVVVGGSVRRRAGAVRISARLISVADGFQLWARHLTRPEAEVLRLNDEVAQAIVEALTLDAVSARVRDVAMNPAALDLFLRARHEYRRFWSPGARRAIELYEQALALAPGDPMILSAYALARCRMWFFTGEGGEAATQAAEQAVMAAPDLGEARLGLASVRYQMGEMVAAVRELKRALAQSPGLAEARSMLGAILLEAGGVEEGRALIEAALSLDPTFSQGYAGLIRMHAFDGTKHEIDALMHRAAQAGSETGAVQLRLALWRRDVEAAVQIERGLPQDRGMPIMQGLLYILKHRRLPDNPPEFLASANAPGATPRRRSFVRQIHAEVCAYLNQTDDAISALQDALNEGLMDLVWLERCPLFEEVRAAPGYPAIHAVVKRRADEILAAYRAA